MPLVPQQDIVVVTVSSLDSRPRGQSLYEAAALALAKKLESYPSCRIVAITSHGERHDYALTVVVETI